MGAARDWTIGQEHAEAHEPNAAIVYRFHARDLHLILATAAVGAPGRFRVRLDGQPPGEAHGLDVNADGEGTIVEPRLSQLIRQPGRVTDREFEIEFLDEGARAFCFTFG